MRREHFGGGMRTGTIYTETVIVDYRFRNSRQSGRLYVADDANDGVGGIRSLPRL